MSANNALHIAVLPGDGIGPEVMAPALEVLRKIEANHRPEVSLHRSAGRRQPLPRDRQVDAGLDHQAVRGGRRDPARRLRPAVGALSRQHRDHAAGRTALSFRSLCRRAPGASHSGRAEPDRRRRPARHRSRRDPRIHRRPVRLDGKGRRHPRGCARDAGHHPKDLGTAVRVFLPARRTPQEARPAGRA